MIEVVDLTEGDLVSLARLYKQFWAEESDVTKMQAAFRRLVNNPAYIFLGAKRAGQLVGSVMGIVCEELYGQCRPFMVVENVVVDRRHRRQGAGTQLMRVLEERAMKRGCSYIILVTESRRSDARGFYCSLGYDPDRYKGFKKRLVGGQQSLPADVDKPRG